MTELVLDSDLSSEQREYLELSRSSAQSLLTIIKDILDFSKIEAGKLDLAHESFSLRSFLQRLFGVLDLRAREKGIELSYSVSPNISDTLIADSGRLGQIIMNLISNALKFTDAGGTVTMIVTPGDSKGDEISLVFEIRDSGIGIPEDKQVMIFESFTQVDASASRNYGGIGLGLAICSRLVNLMGGKIWVRSQLGKGSSFFFTIDALIDVKKGMTIGIEKSDPLWNGTYQGLKALVIDDHRISQLTVTTRLERLGFEVTTADNGKCGVELTQEQQFDLVFMDCQMPVMDGFEATEAIRQQERETGKHTPIIALTAFAMSGDKERCLEAGMDAYLAKPVPLDSFIQTINQMLGKFCEQKPQIPLIQ